MIEGSFFRKRPARANGVALVGLFVLGALAFLPYDRSSGFSYDDWREQADVQLHGFGYSLHQLLEITPTRPLGAIYFSVVHQLLGDHQHLELAFAGAERLAMCCALFLVLREMAVDAVAAWLCSALALLFPFSDSTWLWTSGGQLDLAVTLWLLGLLVSLRGLRTHRGIAWHAGAVLLYVASVLLYEIALLAVALGGVVYLMRGPARAAVERWAVDAGVALLVGLIFTARIVPITHGQDVHTVQSLSGSLHHAGVIGDQALSITSRSLLPYGSVPRTVILLAAFAILVAGSVIAVRGRGSPRSQRTLRALLMTLIGAGLAILAWAILIPADNYYSPLQVGIGNRINILAGIGLAILIVGTLQVLAALGPSKGRYRAITPTILCVFGGAIAMGYLERLNSDSRLWRQASRAQAGVLRTLQTVVPKPSSGSTIVVRGAPLFAGPGVPVFAASWDLSGATELLWNDATIVGLPAARRGVSCLVSGVSVPALGPLRPAPYGASLLVDMPAGHVTRITDRRACETLAATSN